MTNRRLRVVMPALTFVPGAMGGTETYVRELTRALVARGDVELTVIVSARAAGALPGIDELVVGRVAGGPSTPERLRTIVQASAPGREARDLIARADVVHYPFTVPVPGARTTPAVITLHDVQHLDLPDMFGAGERAYRRFAYERAARRASRIITVSEFSKQRIVERLRVDPARVDVAHPGVDGSAFANPGSPRLPFVLYPATAWPHKNHARLVAAMGIVREQRPELRLVLTGGRRDTLGSLPEWVEHRGHVTEEELRGLFQTATCLAFPSLYEGFGLPPLEAMASGCPVAVATSGSLPEVCGDAAVYFDPTDASSIAMGVLGALAKPTDLASAGATRVREFSWENCAAAHVVSYAQVSGRRPTP